MSINIYNIDTMEKVSEMGIMGAMTLMRRDQEGADFMHDGVFWRVMEVSAGELGFFLMVREVEYA